MLVTNLHIFKLHPKTFKVRRKEIPLIAVLSIRCLSCLLCSVSSFSRLIYLLRSVSPFKDGVVCFHIKPPERDLVLDLNLCGYEGVSELVTVVVDQVLKINGVRTPVTFENKYVFGLG